MLRPEIDQKLLNKLEEHYDSIVRLYEEDFSFEYIRRHLQLTDREMQQMFEVIFDSHPYFTATDSDGVERLYRYNTHTLQIREVTDEEEIY